MLEYFRTQSRSALIYLLLGIIILAFILTFNTSGPITGSGGPQNSDLVEVYGESIRTSDLELAMKLSIDPPPPGLTGYQRWLVDRGNYQRTRMPFSGVSDRIFSLTPFEGKAPPIKSEKVLEELIESSLVAREAAKLGLTVSDNELAARVKRMQRAFGAEFFAKDGSFDKNKYNIFARYTLGTSKASLEDFLRKETLRDKMAQVVIAGVSISPKELDAMDLADGKRPKIEYVAVDATAAKTVVKVSDADADGFAAKHVDKVKGAYEAAGEKYNKPAKYSVRAILTKAPRKDEKAKDAEKAKVA
jgi:hypothetical protein